MVVQFRLCMQAPETIEWRHVGGLGCGMAGVFMLCQEGEPKWRG